MYAFFSLKRRSSCCSHCTTVFCINGGPINYIDEWLHLGHIISSNLDDKSDISGVRSMLFRQTNNVLCFSRNPNHVTKMQLLISYCYSQYRCILWDTTCLDIEMVCTAWRLSVRRVWGLLSHTHVFSLSFD